MADSRPARAHGRPRGDPVGEPRRGRPHRPPRGHPARPPAPRGRAGRRQPGGPHAARPAEAGDPGRSHRHRAGERQRRAPRRGRRAVGARQRRHEGRAGGDGGAGRGGPGAGRRRDLRVLRRGGGGRRAQRPRPPRPRPSGPARRRRRHPRRAHRRRARSRLPGHAADGGHPPRAAGPHRPAVDGSQRHPPPRCAPAPRRGFEERRPVIQGCEYREALQAVRVAGGVAGNVVPDLATVTLNRRFAPDRTEAEAADEVRALLAPVLEDGDEVTRRGQRAGRRARSGQPDPAGARRSSTTSPSPPSSAGPTSPASPRSACRRATSGLATPRSPTRPTSAWTALRSSAPTTCCTPSSPRRPADVLPLTSTTSAACRLTTGGRSTGSGVERVSSGERA